MKKKGGTSVARNSHHRTKKPEDDGELLKAK